MDRRAQVKQWLKEVLENNLSGITYQAFIFGSQANKLTLSRSDIDVGIIADVKISNEILVRINSALEKLPMLFCVDIIDFTGVDEGFKSVALSNTEQL